MEYIGKEGTQMNEKIKIKITTIKQKISSKRKKLISETAINLFATNKLMKSVFEGFFSGIIFNLLFFKMDFIFTGIVFALIDVVLTVILQLIILCLVAHMHKKAYGMYMNMVADVEKMFEGDVDDEVVEKANRLLDDILVKMSAKQY